MKTFRPRIPIQRNVSVMRFAGMDQNYHSYQVTCPDDARLCFPSLCFNSVSPSKNLINLDYCRNISVFFLGALK